MAREAKEFFDGAKTLRKKSRLPESEKTEARELRESAGANEKFCKLLDSVNFRNSRLSRELIEKKTHPAQHCGDLEYTIGWLKQQIRKYPERKDVPCISELNQRLCRLIIKYKESVENGYEKSALASRGALLKGFKDILFPVLSKDDEEICSEKTERYMQKCVDYLDRWLNLIDHTLMADTLEINVNRAERSYKSFVKKRNDSLDRFEKEILSDSDILADYYAVSIDDSAGKGLTDAQNLLRLRMIEYGIQATVGAVNEKIWCQCKAQQIQINGRIDILRADVEQLPLPDFDADAYDRSLDYIFERVADIDVEIEQNINRLANLNGRLEAMDCLNGKESVLFNDELAASCDVNSDELETAYEINN